ncbi:hypothetical protein GCM10010197_37030 [Nocardioides luteus]|uniref:Uncharacterized protein n=1 Tax=Nocardioides luteus TaxID=1844 RepID=A0ABQ5SUY6_9ACTN|nr:hypothetical protein GCM10010197_37030 [Nocardioides luteus]GLJ68008.1 hypothetical protein GCM10017579_20440 [Nocardioides luteus]
MGVRGEQLGGHLDVARGVEAAYGHAPDLQRRAHSGSEISVALEQEPDHLGPHHTAPEDGDAQGFDGVRGRLVAAHAPRVSGTGSRLRLPL